MRGPSFRWKLASMTTGICATVLLFFGAVIWEHDRHVGQEKLDHELRQLADHYFEHFFLDEGDDDEGDEEEEKGWQEVGQDPLPGFFMGEDWKRVEVLVLDERGEKRFRSPGLSPGLARSMSRRAGLEFDKIADASEKDLGLEAASDPEDWEVGAVAFMEDVEADGRSWRLYTTAASSGLIAVAVDLSRFRAAQLHFLLFGLLVLGVALLLAGMAAWWMAHRALRPVLALTRSMEEITADRLQDRLPEDAGDREFRRMIQVFNGMLERLQRSFEQAARFSADASHEMKTPLTIMQGQIEAALSSVPEASPAQQALAIQLEELHRLKGLVEKLLLLSRVDSGRLVIAAELVDLSGMLRSTCEDLEILAPELDVSCQIDESVTVRGDSGLLQQVLQNLVSNAIKYNREQGWIRLMLSSQGEEVVLQVCNSGPALDAGQAKRIFDRFYRGDASRNRAIDGLGLGLSLALEIAKAHGGSLDWMPVQEEGNCFCLRLPIAKP